MPVSLPPELARLLAAHEPAAREAAWAEFARLHARLLLHVARTIGRDYDSAMDAYAYLLERLQEDDYHRLRVYVADGRSRFTTWLVVVARRLCLDHYRSRYGRTRARGAAGATTETHRATRRRLVDLVAVAVDSDLGLVAGGATPDEELRSRQLSETLAAALGRLPPSDRLLLTLRFEDDLSAREIAAVLSLPTPFHVYRRLRAVLERVKQLLRQGGVEDAAP
jgi:RNA polymerase sigma factor (sigma-70 family)